MKKLVFIFCLLPLLTQIGFAQGARQDVNLSLMGTIQPYVSGSNTYNNTQYYVQQKSTLGVGLYLGYRYLLTPNGGIEANYSYTRFTNKLATSATYARVYTSMQEASAAYVRSFVFKKFNPFLEAGGGMMFFSPIGFKSTSYDTEMSESFSALFGGGIAYELSPSWDLRVQYRGQTFKVNDFGLKQFDTGRRYVVSQPAIGIAYHF